jgi:hypothetical protein
MGQLKYRQIILVRNNSTQEMEETRTFVQPGTKIKSIDMLNKFLESESCKKYTTFLENLNESVVGIETTATVTISPVWIHEKTDTMEF